MLMILVFANTHLNAKASSPSSDTLDILQQNIRDTNIQEGMTQYQDQLLFTDKDSILYTMKKNKTSKKVITKSEVDRPLVFGSWVYYTTWADGANGSLWRMKPNGSDKQKITTYYPNSYWVD
jgi:hypothetical protein